MMNVRDYARLLVTRFEGCKLVAYRTNADDPWTCGWGETSGVSEGTTWTQQEADARRDARLEQLEIRVRALVLGLSEQQYGALVSFVYNLGEGTLERSTLLVLIKTKAWFSVIRSFLNYDNSSVGGARVPRKGLLRRRLAEAAMFLDGTQV